MLKQISYLQYIWFGCYHCVPLLKVMFLEDINHCKCFLRSYYPKYIRMFLLLTTVVHLEKGTNLENTTPTIDISPLNTVFWFSNFLNKGIITIHCFEGKKIKYFDSIAFYGEWIKHCISNLFSSFYNLSKNNVCFFLI